MHKTKRDMMRQLAYKIKQGQINSRGLALKGSRVNHLIRLQSKQNLDKVHRLHGQGQVCPHSKNATKQREVISSLPFLVLFRVALLISFSSTSVFSFDNSQFSFSLPPLLFLLLRCPTFSFLKFYHSYMLYDVLML